ncbi:MAG TPA: hypothetical protein VFE46_11310 [Pirellulales bacterium]|jgi:hypothetical protein|nr:hypothetical protein [Pirellulales bacterium]
MTPPEPNAILNRLLVTIYRSLPMYLADAVPWMHPGDEKAKHALNHIVADCHLYAGKVAELLLSRRRRFSFGEYPMVFTDTHDLSLDYLINELIYYQKQDVAAIAQCMADLNSDPAAHALAEEALGNARGHLESLEELIRQPVPAA